MPASTPFSSLPLDQQGPPGNAWGLFGTNDELGMLNLLKPSTTKAAAASIESGVRISVDWPLNRMAVPCFGRAAFRHEIKNKAPRSVNDDTVTFNTQISSQWDGFRHYGFQKERLYFQGRKLEELRESTVNGINVWVENGGIVGRGVLLDYASWAESLNMSPKPFETTSISLSDLQKVAEAQGTEFQEGDILLIRSGWGKAYTQLTPDECQALAEKTSPPAIGVQSCEEILQWIWETGFSAVAGDMPSFEAWPCQDTKFWLHEWLLAGWGCPIGELFDLERLSEECKKAKRYTFFFSSMPLNVPGGVASPPNGVAIL